MLVCPGRCFLGRFPEQGHLGWVLKAEKEFARQGGCGNCSPSLQSSDLVWQERRRHSPWAMQWDFPIPGLDVSFLVTLGFGVHPHLRSRQQGMGKGGGRQQS